MRKGRELELLVARIKELQLPDARVSSPEIVRDQDTGQEREVDVGVRVQRHSGPIFIALECRDRAATQDVQWVEQLIAKKESVRADVLVGVSSSGFSEPARVKALKRGVLLAQMTDRLPDDIAALTNAVFITLTYVAPRLIAVNLAARTPLALPLEQYKYRHKSLTRDLTLDELCVVWSHPNLIRTITGKINDFEKAKFAKVSLSEIGARVRTDLGEFDITGAELSYELNYGELPLPLISIREYRATDLLDHDNATAFTFGTQQTTLSEILLDQKTNVLRWDLIGEPLLSEGKIVIGGKLKARQPVGLEVMRLDL